MAKLSTVLHYYLQPWARVTQQGSILESPIVYSNPAILANHYFFDHPQWLQHYFETCYRDEALKERWQKAGGSWDRKVVVDIGCGPGNLYATVGGMPKVLIGVDISRQALQMAQQLGYTPLLADAHDLPLISGFADLVVLNATLHHCENMFTVLREAARLVRPGGTLIADHHPQLTAWNYQGMAWLSKLCLPYWLLSGFETREEILYLLLSEIHRQPGDGVTAELFYQGLEPLGFAVKLYPHNHTVGTEALQGKWGRKPLWIDVVQKLSGIAPHSSAAALSLMCVAQRHPLLAELEGVERK